jgi:hypothetical protein
MSSVGKPVYNINNVNLISFGTVVEEKIEESWKWYRVKWANIAPTNPYGKLNLSPETGWFRCDTVKLFDPVELVSNIFDVSDPAETLANIDITTQ